MREIKFRGMDSNGDWHYGLVGYKSTTLLPGGKTGWFISDIDGSPWAYQVRPETIGQYTGLKDSAGKEIYEGDIVDLVTEIAEPAVIEWDEITACFNILSKSGGFSATFDNYCGDDLEVISNIYENPELLEDNNVH